MQFASYYTLLSKLSLKREWFAQPTKVGTLKQRYIPFNECKHEYVCLFLKFYVYGNIPTSNQTLYRINISKNKKTKTYPKAY